MGTVGSGAFSGESSFFLGTVGTEHGVASQASNLPLEMPPKKHKQEKDRRSIKTQGQQFQRTNSEEKSNHSTPLLRHDALPKAGREGRCSLSLSAP